jgi:hypothetical protein
MQPFLKSNLSFLIIVELVMFQLLQQQIVTCWLSRVTAFISILVMLDQ